MTTLVRRLLILVAVGVVSGVLAYIVNGRAQTASSASGSQPQLKLTPPAAPRRDLSRLESCLRAQGASVPLRAALFACRQYLPARPFGDDRGFGVDRDGDGPL